jgi:hypothetical protein
MLHLCFLYLFSFYTLCLAAVDLVNLKKIYQIRYNKKALPLYFVQRWCFFVFLGMTYTAALALRSHRLRSASLTLLQVTLR